jgi:hypothetical protein
VKRVRESSGSFATAHDWQHVRTVCLVGHAATVILACTACFMLRFLVRGGALSCQSVCVDDGGVLFPGLAPMGAVPSWRFVRWLGIAMRALFGARLVVVDGAVMVSEHPEDSSELQSESRAELFIDAHPGFFRTDGERERFIGRYVGYVAAMEKDNADYVRYGMGDRVSAVRAPGAWWSRVYS